MRPPPPAESVESVKSVVLDSSSPNIPCLCALNRRDWIRAEVEVVQERGGKR
jgi:hypothetical protein